MTWEDERGEREIREMGEKWRLETMTEAGGSHLTPLGDGLMTSSSLLVPCLLLSYAYLLYLLCLVQFFKFYG